MKANELMVGDFVTRQNYENKVVVCKIIGLSKNSISVEFDNGSRSMGASEDSINPIPLTPEILEKNGFYLGYTSNQEDAASQIHCTLPEPMWTWDEGAGSIQISFPNESDGGEMYLSDQNFDRDLHFVFCENIYVHELQHALKLCHIEKTIEL